MAMQSPITPEGFKMMEQMAASGTARKGRQESRRQANMQTAESRRASMALEDIRRQQNMLTARSQELQKSEAQRAAQQAQTDNQLRRDALNQQIANQAAQERRFTAELGMRKSELDRSAQVSKFEMLLQLQRDANNRQDSREQRNLMRDQIKAGMHQLNHNLGVGNVITAGGRGAFTDLGGQLDPGFEQSLTMGYLNNGMAMQGIEGSGAAHAIGSSPYTNPVSATLGDFGTKLQDRLRRDYPDLVLQESDNVSATFSQIFNSMWAGTNGPHSGMLNTEAEAAAMQHEVNMSESNFDPGFWEGTGNVIAFAWEGIMGGGGRSDVPLGLAGHVIRSGALDPNVTFRGNDWGEAAEWILDNNPDIPMFNVNEDMFRQRSREGENLGSAETEELQFVTHASAVTNSMLFGKIGEAQNIPFGSAGAGTGGAGSIQGILGPNDPTKGPEDNGLGLDPVDISSVKGMNTSEWARQTINYYIDQNMFGRDVNVTQEQRNRLQEFVDVVYRGGAEKWADIEARRLSPEQATSEWNAWNTAVREEFFPAESEDPTQALLMNVGSHMHNSLSLIASTVDQPNAGRTGYLRRNQGNVDVAGSTLNFMLEKAALSDEKYAQALRNIIAPLEGSVTTRDSLRAVGQIGAAMSLTAFNNSLRTAQQQINPDGSPDYQGAADALSTGIAQWQDASRRAMIDKQMDQETMDYVDEHFLNFSPDEISLYAMNKAMINQGKGPLPMWTAYEAANPEDAEALDKSVFTTPIADEIGVLVATMIGYERQHAQATRVINAQMGAIDASEDRAQKLTDEAMDFYRNLE